MTPSMFEIINGKYWNEESWIEFKSIRIIDGVIASIDQNDQPFKPQLTIDAKGGIVSPGLFDLNVALREPGYTRNGTIDSETRAAAAAGITHLCCTPDSNPINDTKAVTKLIKEQAKNAAHCEVLPLGALTKQLEGELLSAHASLKDAGCVALSNGTFPLANLLVTQRCFEYAKTQNMPVFITPMERDLYQGCMHEGVVSTAIGLKGIPAIAESIAVAQLLQLASATGVQLHLSQISCADSVSLIAEAKSKGTNVSADVAIANLLYTHMSVKGFDSQYHCTPPLRTEDDRRALLRGVKDGVIDAICSAHRPLEAAEKSRPFAETAVGMSSIEALIPAAIVLADRKELELEVFLKAMTANPRQILQMENVPIKPGNIANIAVIDTSYECELTQESLFSKGKNTMLLNQTIAGRVLATFSSGRLTHTN